MIAVGQVIYIYLIQVILHMLNILLGISQVTQDGTYCDTEFMLVILIQQSAINAS
jgi:hypothetical protein